ncbi:MAG: [FeFe] hydrogenase H-cluster radical SAM maturase HydG, partial [Elusimicrobiota bacterium]|nr:[FeFe] hydrogenase H-cluster radical SAM maturase HydG [Elusimicrobiota bacterium]
KNIFLDKILAKSKNLKNLDLEEVAFLLNCDNPDDTKKIFETASFVKNEIYGKRIVLFAPLYFNNICGNDCKYCAFQKSNKILERKALSYNEIKKQTEFLLKRGQKRILLVGSEAGAFGKKPIDYYLECIDAVYSAECNGNKIRRVNINVAPLEVAEFKKLKKAGIGTYQIFQETYHEKTYAFMHPNGPKKDPNNRISAIPRAFEAGIDDVGMGVLFGLYDYKFEVLALLMHIKTLEEKYGIGPHTISVPRIEPAIGVDFEKNKKSYHFVKDAEFEKLVAIMRLAVPYVGLILSTRETPEMRNKLLNLGISQMSAESSVAPGGYETKNKNSQFVLNDDRPIEKIVETIMDYGFIPSFCTACYRSNRTGKNFMDITKLGNIKGKCLLNSLITLKEYILEFGDENLNNKANKILKKEIESLDKNDKEIVKKYFFELETGEKDKFI